MAGVLPRQRRQEQLQERVRENPFLTDEELAREFGVSVQTIRLDRMALGIPDVRERTRVVAEKTYGLVKSMGSREVVGELVDVVLGESGISLLETSSEMGFEKTGIVRSQHIFAQADSLALSIIDADVAVTGLVNAKFKQPARVRDRLIARAEVIRRKGNKYVVLVQTRAGGSVVFRGKFVVVALDGQKGAAAT